MIEDSFAAFNAAAHARAREMTRERRQADIEEGRVPYNRGGDVVIDHDADIETDDLVEAMRRIESALAVVGDHPSLVSASGELRATGDTIVDAETFEDKLRQGLDHAHRAEDSVGQYRQFLARQHREGRLRLSNDAVIYVDACMTAAADALSRWVDYAVNELRSLAA